MFDINCFFSISSIPTFFPFSLTPNFGQYIGWKYESYIYPMLCSLAAYSHSAFLFCCILCLVVTHFGAYLLVQLCFSTCFCTFSHFSLHITFHSQIHISCTSFLPFLSFPFFAFSFPLLFPFPSRFLSSLLYEQYEGPHRDTRWNWILILLFFYLLHKSKLILWRLFFFLFQHCPSLVCPCPERWIVNEVYFCQVKIYYLLWDIFQPHFCCQAEGMKR